MVVVRIGEEVHTLVIFGMILVVDEQAVDGYLSWHKAGVAEIMHPVVPHTDHIRPGHVSAGRNPAAVSDDQVALPGTAIVAAEIDQGVAVQGGILNCQQTSTDGVESHMTQVATADCVGATNPHMRIHSGESTVLEQDVLAEVRADHAPARAVADVVHSAVDHAEIHHIVCIIVVRTHVDWLPR
ncbi:hypothetical protein CMK17_21855 [Candidatus Poribacteria bacterium]|nr:hypothetical protein [Candidatus Poribacteria bacterium]